MDMPAATGQRTATTVLSTEDVAEHDRVDYWRQRFGAIWGTVDVQRGTTPSFYGRVASTSLGPLRINQFMLRDLRFSRSPSGERTAPFYSLAFPQRGRLAVRQSGQDFIGGPGSLYLVHNGEPGHAVIDTEYQSLSVQIPMELFRQFSPELPRLRDWPLAEPGMATLIQHFVLDLLAQAPTASPQAAHFLSGQLCELVAFLIADSRAVLASDTTILRAHRGRALRHIDKMFHRVDLSPVMIAAACGISSSYLHKVFAVVDLSVMGEVRRIRLAQAHTLLAAPQFGSHSVSEIAVRCGFKSLQDFSRAFRRAYGQSPSTYRTAVF